MANRKKHLKYRATKPTSTTGTLREGSRSGDIAKPKDSRADANKKKKRLVAAMPDTRLSSEKFSALSGYEALVVRKELIHLLIAAAGLVVLYVALWFVLARAGVESYLTQFIKLR